MCKSYSLSGLVLFARAAEQVENTLMVLGVDAPAIVRDLENRKTELCPSSDMDLAGNPGFEIFERVVDQVREYLFDCKAVADDRWQRFDGNLSLGLRGL